MPSVMHTIIECAPSGCKDAYGDLRAPKIAIANRCGFCHKRHRGQPKRSGDNSFPQKIARGIAIASDLSSHSKIARLLGGKKHFRPMLRFFPLRQKIRRTLCCYTKGPLQDSAIISPLLEWRHPAFYCTNQRVSCNFSNRQDGKSTDSSA